jgi:HD-GYP domain-containing protein (c-di-GMP phosphodiesterase class II)
MKRPKIKLEHGILRSKVARRIFFIFITCALLPLTLLAFFSFRQVSRQLYDQAEQRLHQEAKSTGMTLIERILILEDNLDTIIRSLVSNDDSTVNFTSPEFNARYKNRFISLALTGDNNQIITSFGAVQNRPGLTKKEKEHVRSGNTLVKTQSKAVNHGSVFMVRQLFNKKYGDALLFGEVNPGYFWKSKKFLPPTTELFVFDENNELLFSSFPGFTPQNALETAMKKRSASRQFTWKYNKDEYLASYWIAFMTPQFLTKWTVVYSQSKSHILGALGYFKKIFMLVALLTFLVVLYLSLSLIRRNLRHIEILQRAISRIKAKDFESQIRIKSNDEFEELGSAFNDMSSSIKNYIESITTINKIGISLTAEKNINHLMTYILNGAMRLINADAGFLYTINENQEPIISNLHIRSLNLFINATNFNDNFSFSDSRDSLLSELGASSIFNEVSLNIPDIYDAAGFNFSGNLDIDKKTGYRSKSSLSIPMKNHEDVIIGVLQLINAKNRKTGNIVPFSEEAQEIAENLASVAAVTVSKTKLLDDFKKLFDSLVGLISTAIDEKSSYTGGHCKRVTELTDMIAKAACNKKDGIFRDFSLSDQDLYELRIAATLHDCGKIITPVHIEDKATKLQTLFDRIELIDIRIEIMMRDAHISFLEKKLSSQGNGDNSDIAAAEHELMEQIRELKDDKEFLHVCNVGNEFLDESHQNRIRNIANKYTWINSEGEKQYILSGDEIGNLSVSKGTLTPEEREIINAHAVNTAKILESLYYPESLRNVPIFAKVHHERVDGSGYPLGLKIDQIPVQGRMLAIADVFEALTARDRPYKDRYTLMQALRILGFMKQNGHIDPEIFDIFISKKVYLRYAEKYLHHDQIDEVNPSEIPGYAMAK